jgi:hypothetical protein
MKPINKRLLSCRDSDCINFKRNIGCTIERTGATCELSQGKVLTIKETYQAASVSSMKTPKSDVSYPPTIRGEMLFIEAPLYGL